VSKFFKALETAERERTHESAQRDVGAPAATASETVVAEPEAAPPAATPAAPAPAAPPPAALAPARGHTPAYGAPLRDAGRGDHAGRFGDFLPTEAESEEARQLDDHLVSLLEPTSAAAEQYRTVRLHIENLRRERQVQVVAVSSSARGEGKTLTAINLAGALAQSQDTSVVLVEADLRHPAAHRYLGLPAGRGLSTYLLDAKSDASTLLERPAGVGFAVIPGGPASSMPYELLKSPRLQTLLAMLREQFDFVVVDAPPVLLFPDAGLLRNLVDGFVVVVRAQHTPREMLRDSVSVLGPTRVLGLIFNDHDRGAPPLAGDANGGWRGYLGRSGRRARAA
jgi:protein-tyrosine kinase